MPSLRSSAASLTSLRRGFPETSSLRSPAASLTSLRRGFPETSSLRSPAVCLTSLRRGFPETSSILRTGVPGDPVIFSSSCAVMYFTSVLVFGGCSQEREPLLSPGEYPYAGPAEPLLEAVAYRIPGTHAGQVVRPSRAGIRKPVRRSPLYSGYPGQMYTGRGARTVFPRAGDQYLHRAGWSIQCRGERGKFAISRHTPDKIPEHSSHHSAHGEHGNIEEPGVTGGRRSWIADLPDPPCYS